MAYYLCQTMVKISNYIKFTWDLIISILEYRKGLEREER